MQLLSHLPSSTENRAGLKPGAGFGRPCMYAPVGRPAAPGPEGLGPLVSVVARSRCDLEVNWTILRSPDEGFSSFIQVCW